MHNDHGAVTIIRFPQLYDEPQTGWRLNVCKLYHLKR
jgi:hypothetical protein